MNEKPDYVPEVGWFFELGLRPRDRIAWYDGKRMNCVRSVEIKADYLSVSAKIEILDFGARVTPVETKELPIKVPIT